MCLQMAQYYSFLWMSNKYSIVYMYHIFFIHLPVDGHLGCFHAAVENMNMGVQISLRGPDLSSVVVCMYTYILIAGSYSSSTVNF